MSRMRRTVLTVFIGSPSDLQDERKKAHEVVQRLNNSLGRNLGLTVDLRGWEDTLPSLARPQAKINEDIRRSDLFVGLVWKRWGTKTGKYSSGFEEEFMLAKARHASGDLEDIWLFFKKVPQEMLRDPGDQLRQVLEFRDLIDASREILYESFDSVTDWGDLFHDYLINYLSQDFSNLTLAQAGAAPSSEDAPTKDDKVENTLLHSLQALASAVQRGNLVEIDSFQSVRSYLASLASLYASRQDTQLMGVHENQLLFYFRGQVELLPIERSYVLRSLAADNFDLNAGWFWLSGVSDNFALLLLAICLRDSLDEVKTGTLRLIEHLDVEVDFEHIGRIIDSSDSSVAQRALAAYGQCASREGLEELHALLEDESSEVADAAWRAAIAILVRHDPKEAIEWLRNRRDSRPSRKNGFLDTLEPIWTSVPTQMLKVFLEDRDPVIRQKAFEAVKAVLSTDALTELTSDPSEWLRSASFEELASRNVEVDVDAMEETIEQAKVDTLDLVTPRVLELKKPLPLYSLQDVRLKCYKNWPYERLQEGIGWYRENQFEKYEALADTYFDQFKDILRSDLEDRFERLRRTVYPEELRKGPALREELSRANDVDDFIRDQFRKAAYHALAEHAEPQDLRFARSFLRNPNSEFFTEELASASFRLLEKHGTPDDTDILKRFLSSSLNKLSSEDRSKAARLILSLDPDNSPGNAAHLIGLDNTQVTRGVLQYSLTNERALSLEELTNLLFNNAQDIRLDALAFLINKLSRQELISLLDEYPTLRDTYYYNVVCWLDRALYAPSGLRAFYETTLKQRLSDASN